MREIIIPINEVDPLIRKTIVELNQKCYYTMFSCQGHYNGLKPTYIVFKGRVKFPSMPRGFETNKRFDRIFRTNRTRLINWGVEYKTERKVNETLFEWATGLPSRCTASDTTVVKLDLKELGGMVVVERK